MPVTAAEGRLGPVQKIEDFIMWGYGPSGIVGTILVIVVILLLLGRI